MSQLKDSLGRETAVNRLPQRIVSLAPSNTEILFALGLDAEVVGVTELCDYPPQARLKEKIGGFLEPQIQRIKALQPDIILAYGDIHEPQVKELEREGQTIWVANPKTVKEVFENIEEIGMLTGRVSFAQDLTLSLRRRVGKVERKIDTVPCKTRSRVLRVMSYEPLIIAGSGSVQYDAIALSGGENISLPDSSAFPSIALETLRDYDPEVIITCDWKKGEVVEGLKGWGDMAAIRNARIYSLPCGISCRPGPRVVELVERIAKFLYPHLFEQTYSRACR